MLMEKDSLPVEYKGKSLSEITIDVLSEYAEEDNSKINGKKYIFIKHFLKSLYPEDFHIISIKFSYFTLDKTGRKF